MLDKIIDSFRLRRSWPIVLFGMLLAPLVLDAALLVAIRFKLTQDSPPMLWMPVATGVGCSLLLPTAHFGGRFIIASAYAAALVSALLFVNITVGCLITGECL